MVSVFCGLNEMLETADSETTRLQAECQPYFPVNCQSTVFTKKNRKKPRYKRVGRAPSAVTLAAT